MRVIRADAMGMCFGVRDALRTVDLCSVPEDVTIHGELVHNAEVLAGLAARGFHQAPERDRGAVPGTPLVMITAHGISERERGRLRAAGKMLIDTTCPLVARVHEAARELQASGYHVLVIGKRGHVEVRGIVDDLASFDVIETPADVRRWAHAQLGILSQSTAAVRDVAAIVAAVRERNPHAKIKTLDTVCRPTKDRQEAVDRLVAHVDAIVVVGGRNSNNTKRLVARCEELRVDVLHVTGPADLDPEWCAGRTAVGLTAGTSTPDATIDAVARALEAL